MTRKEWKNLCENEIYDIASDLVYLASETGAEYTVEVGGYSGNRLEIRRTHTFNMKKLQEIVERINVIATLERVNIWIHVDEEHAIVQSEDKSMHVQRGSDRYSVWCGMQYDLLERPEGIRGEKCLI